MALQLNTEQKQILSQKMIQSAKILQMTAEQLEEYLNELSMENPLLDLVQKQPDDFNDKELEKYQWLSSQDEQNRYLYQKIDTPDEESQNWNINQEQPESLHQHLWSQLFVKKISQKDEEAYHYLLESLDSRGYFTDSLSEFADRFDISLDHGEYLLHSVQQLTPSGVGARNLEECLCIQLEQQGLLTEELKEFICHHLEEMAKNQLPAISRAMKIPMETIKEYRRMIKTLEPRPAMLFNDSRQASYINPDVIIVKFKGHFDILLNETLYPDITLNAGYVKMCKENADQEVKQYLLKKIHQVEWVKQCIVQRNTTLLRVSQAIFTKQEDFFKRGPAYMKPLRLIDLAELLEIHESTVSRAVREKYLQCSWGIFPLSHFFQKSAPDGQRKDEVKSDSAEKSTVSDVKAALKELIQTENKKKPYSDQLLSDLLTKQGFPIKRRTVSKYREEELIPNASGRKEY